MIQFKNQPMTVEMKIPKEMSKIDASDLGELIWWSNHLGICPERILSIIDIVGPSTRNIVEYHRLNNKH